MSQKQLNSILQVVSSNHQGDYNYKELLQRVFGAERGERLFFMDIPSLDAEYVKE